MLKVLVIVMSLVFIQGCSSSKKAENMEAPKEAPMKAKETKSEKKAMDKPMKKVEAEAATNLGDSVNCKIDNDERTIAVAQNGNGCVVQYTKNGETNDVATANNGNSHCKKVQENMVKNLTNAGFSCK